MAERKDAGLTLVRLIAAIDEEFKKATGPRSVWTCGRMEFDPGAPSVIPGEARAMFQFRDSDPAILNRLEMAQHMARVMRAAMLFVPSINGISHHWAENTSDEDIVLGARIFTDAIASVLMTVSSERGRNLLSAPNHGSVRTARAAGGSRKEPPPA
jgi:beta-ureidopropionase / N-carbamoyl-L-amino-acid hydrolase